MNRRLAFSALLLLTTAAAASQRNEYVQEWPLQLTKSDAGAYRVVLTAPIYRAVHDATLADIEVFNGAGEAMPAALLGPEDPSAQHRELQTQTVPWFRAPSSTSAQPVDWRVRAQLDTQGRVLRIETTLPDPAAPTRVPSELLLDLSQIKTPPSALRLQWDDSSAAFEVRLALAGSDDLQRWDGLGQAVLADLRNGEERLRQDRIALQGFRHYRYLRLSPSSTHALPELSAILGETPPPSAEPEWRWESLAGERHSDGKLDYFLFDLPAYLPVQRVDVLDSAGNSAVDWTVYSRHSVQASWQLRAGPWTGYRISTGTHVDASSVQALGASVRDRNWRVDASPAPASTPTLSIGYRPEVLVFLAQGDGPYTLAAGSAKARRTPAPIGVLLREMRRRHGADWTPAAALPQAARPLAGSAALTPMPPPVAPTDWKAWLLWGLLIAGTIIVAAMAFSLLRKTTPPAE